MLRMQCPPHKKFGEPIFGLDCLHLSFLASCLLLLCLYWRIATFLGMSKDNHNQLLDQWTVFCMCTMYKLGTTLTNIAPQSQ